MKENYVRIIDRQRDEDLESKMLLLKSPDVL